MGPTDGATAPLEAAKTLLKLEAVVPGVLSHFQERGRGVVEPSLRRLLDFFRAHGFRVIYTTVASELPDGSDLMPIFQQRNGSPPGGPAPGFLVAGPASR